MKQIIRIIDELYSETYYKKYYTAEHKLASNNYDQKREEYLNKIGEDLKNDFICLEDLRSQIEIAYEDELMQFVFDFCCNLFFDMFLNCKKFLS